ncbi:CoA-acylating methylmalonate-semialdehyde dehydrogenase [Hahella sp. CR1]|uniref:CoA-acylating methylmalonate-semialdehyde dehydrogenase n=1 Tax=unclassified Hahella TaxID=2624107 RepID=UPI0024426D71|nr:CoA-acylating methylmalonate-semialdehyde dehydrogenase [Hahella sp. CR1]MDG9668807.1 CoA-acylating methylmalonate-semialdehyde dehydrogenase [Hahella sp. CR1]
MQTRVPLYIDGSFTESAATRHIPNLNPATQLNLADTPCATPDEVNRAVASAKQAFETWKDVPVIDRARLMMKFVQLLKQNQDEIAEILSQETGKIFADAKGDVWRGIEVVEHACNIPSMMMGETVENVARDIDTSSYMHPLGVCAGITPFNFPAMIPLWMFPMALACGNTFVLKPSEQDPLTPMRIAQLFDEAGFPKGVLQVLHGDREQVDMLLTHPDIKAISFVGSAPVGQHIYRTGTQHLKRVQCMTGAKNHMVIMPDADKKQVISHLTGASVGAAGQRCMAISVAVFVGESAQWLDELKASMAEVKPGAWNDEAAGYGPLISRGSRDRVLGLLAKGKEEGAQCLLDGSSFTHPDFPEGNWVGPTLFSKVTPEMTIYREEIFGPVLLAMQVDTIDDALKLINDNPFGNGVSLFTNSGGAARHFQRNVQVGQVGINIPIPVPLPFFSFTGWRNSFYGDQHAYGKQAVRFYTETKTVISRWFHHGEEVQGPNLTIQMR